MVVYMQYKPYNRTLVDMAKKKALKKLDIRNYTDGRYVNNRRSKYLGETNKNSRLALKK